MKKHRYYVFVFASLFSAAIILSSCSGGGGGGGGSAPFSQADLAGTWYVSILQAGSTVAAGTDPGWLRGIADIASSGTISVPALYSSLSVTTPAPGPSGIVWTVDPWTGIISETSGTYATDFHGKLASNKNIIVGTATSGSNSVQLRILQKRVPGTTYSASDIENTAFTMHQMDSGASGIWTYATGTTDSTANAFLDVMTRPTGTSAGGPAGKLFLDTASGIVTLGTNSNFEGMLSPDKTYMIATETDNSNSNIFRLTVAQFAQPGQAFAVSDLAGDWHFHGLISALPDWAYESLSMTPSGQATITSLLTSHGTSTDLPAPADISIDPDGTAAVLNDPTFHGTLSSGKDMLVSTQTITDGVYMLGVTVK